jgi:hypothetical protein
MSFADLLARYDLTNDHASNLAKLATFDLDKLGRMRADLAETYDAIRRDPTPSLADANSIVDAITVVAQIEQTQPITASAAPGSSPLPSLGNIATPAPPTARPVADSAPFERTRGMRVTGGDPRISQVAQVEHVDLDALAHDACEVHDWIRSQDGLGWQGVERLGIGKVRWPFDEDRQLHNQTDASPENYNQKLDALMHQAWNPSRWTPEALAAQGLDRDVVVASGGFCAPAQPDYSQLVVAGAERPVADGIPTYLADRGQVIVTQPVRLSDVTTSTAQTAGSAISVWTNAVDTAPGGTTKPFAVMPCPTPLTVTTEAIVQQTQFSNFEGRAYPELIQGFMQTVLAQWTRRAESELLRQIDTNCTAQTTTSVLGATADLLSYISQAAAMIRNVNRMPANARLRLLAPLWIVDFIAADLARMHAGDGLDRFLVNDAQVRAMFDARDVNVSFYQDTATGGGTTNMLFNPPQAGADLPNFPPGAGTANTKVVFYLFPEGTFSRADGGTLDLGIVRDSTLNNTNDFRYFAESWEAILPKVHTAIRVTSTVCANGRFATDTDPSAYCSAS